MSAPGPALTTLARGANDAERLWLLGGLYTFRASGDETGAAYTLFEVRGPGGLATPVHRHQNEEEGFYIVDGAVTVFADSVEHELGPGGFAFVPRGTPHAFRLDSTEATLLLLISPGGAGHEPMFREMGESAPEAVLPGPSAEPVDPGVSAAIAERYGTIIVGPPPMPR
jgi:quercetin dioxygenase-like cupin family protein